MYVSDSHTLIIIEGVTVLQHLPGINFPVKIVINSIRKRNNTYIFATRIELMQDKANTT